MSFCQHCGKALKPGGNFCEHCGANLQGPPASVPVPSQTPVLSVCDSIRKLAASLDATIEDKGGVLTLRKVVAERKAFLSTKRLEYSAKIRITDSSREVKFTEMLKESGSGLDGMDAGDRF